MALQNSLDRIFEAMVTQLRQVVAPGLEDPYAKSQALAMAEMLANLQTRVEWRCQQLREEISDVQRALAEPGPPLQGLTNSELIEARRMALAALAAAQREAPSPELAARVMELVHRRLEAELARVRTGMYR